MIRFYSLFWIFIADPISLFLSVSQCRQVVWKSALAVDRLSWDTRLQSEEHSQSGRFTILPARGLYRNNLYMYIVTLVYPSCLLLLV